ncbi:hypothetical protein C0039_06900 [Pseudohalioglobus lutimaris]|uniref:Uncharacterized protein n=1 Tax=Pseudohalioglobus lutimaris TaxID=1737061 RepID=A0A2N5X5H4_9GAMM|nr:hypothetical protein C0039_06900 [Pseudohalioglobus lutimaris]
MRVWPLRLALPPARCRITAANGSSLANYAHCYREFIDRTHDRARNARLNWEQLSPSMTMAMESA